MQAWYSQTVTLPACSAVEKGHVDDTSARGTTMVANTIVDVEINEAAQRLASACVP